MSRRDTILIAVIINAGLLAVLFATAIIYDNDKILDQHAIEGTLVKIKPEPPAQDVPHHLIAITSGDETDQVLRTYPYQAPYTTTEISTEPFIQESHTPQTLVLEEEEVKEIPSTTQFVEVTVKKGDALDKIARANGTTVAAIKKANQLQSERLQIGQVLKIPIQKNANLLPIVRIKSEKKEIESNDTGQYYTMRSGDSPWKVARQFNVNFEDILRLNNLDEEKARNLKVGDRIRVK